MKNSDRRLCKIIALLLLLFLTFITASAPFHVAKANPSTLHVPQDFTTIQEAINAANPGDTIQVSGGRTYSENLIITKSLNLEGASPTNTIIDGSGLGSGINITSANDIFISGFTVKNTGQVDSGILIDSSTNTTLSGNVIVTSSATDGVEIINSDSSTVRNNTLTGNLYGVSIFGGFGNLIQGNDVTGNSAGDIYISTSSGNKVADNIIRVSQNGLQLWNGAVGNIVARNLIANNTSHGVFLWNSPSAGNLFIDNRIEFNRYDSNTEGVNIQNSTLNRFYHNSIQTNSIQVFGSTPPDITSNSWDNATGAALKTDAKIIFADSNSNGVWDNNETVVYDKDNDGLYSSSDTVVASANGIVPPAGTLLTGDPRIEFVDTNNDNRWEKGEPVVFDVNGNNIFDPGETAIAGVGGNYWSDYQGLDDGGHGFAGDGIGDTMIPAPCPNGGKPCSIGGPAGVDWYPLTTRWTPHGLNVSISAKPLGGYPPLHVSFSGSAIGGVPPYTYSWNFGDGTTSSQQNTTHTYPIKGAYIATLTVTDASTSSGLDEVSLTVLAPVGNLNLRVIDENMHSIQGANVTLTKTPLGQPKLSSLTNNLGTVGLAAIKVGNYTVQASSPGYVTATRNVTVTVGQTTNDQLVLARTAPIVDGYLSILPIVAIAAGVSALLLSLVFLRRRKKLAKTASSSRL